MKTPGKTVGKTMPQFARSTWVEIFNLLSDDKLKRKLVASGNDADLERDGISDKALASLTAGDWRTIHNEAWEKLYNSPATVGVDATARAWRADLRGILDQLSEYGYCQCCGAVNGKKHHDPDDKRIVTLHASGRWSHSHGHKMRQCMLCLSGAKQIWTAKGEKKAGQV